MAIVLERLQIRNYYGRNVAGMERRRRERYSNYHDRGQHGFHGISAGKEQSVHQNARIGKRRHGARVAARDLVRYLRRQGRTPTLVKVLGGGGESSCLNYNLHI